MQVTQVNTDSRREVRAFVALPYVLYRDSPFWSSLDRGDVTAALNRRRHPFFEHSVADFFLAREGGRLLGRICVTEQRRVNAQRASGAAYFGYFDAIDDSGVVRALFERCEDWARERGLGELIGPHDFFSGGGTGLLVDGFDQPAALGIQYNHAYLPRLVENYGFRKEYDLLSGCFPLPFRFPEVLRKLAERVQRRGKIEITSPRTKSEIRRWVVEAGRLMQRTAMPGQISVPPTDREFAYIARRLMPVLQPDLVKLAFIDGKLSGFLLAYVDVAEALRRCRGRIWPSGWIGVMKSLRANADFNINPLFVDPRYHGTGVNLLLYLNICQTLLSRPNLRRVEAIQIGEQNTHSLSDQVRIGISWNKRHRVYKKGIG